MKKAKEFSRPIFGLLKATKLLEPCEACPSWPTEKAQKYRVKDKRSEQAHTRTELTTGFSKVQNKPKWYFHVKSP